MNGLPDNRGRASGEAAGVRGQAGGAGRAGRGAYEAPALVRLGSVQELTQQQLKVEGGTDLNFTTVVS